MSSINTANSHLPYLSTSWPEFKIAKKRNDEAEAKKEPELVTITLPNGKSTKLPLLHGSEGPDVIDIRQLYAQLGVFTFDPGYTTTCSCTSEITFIDGPAGILSYRGYPIEQLAAQSDFIDCSFLIMYGELPSKSQKDVHEKRLKHHMMVHEKLIQFYHGFKSDAHPMAIMVGVVGALSAFYHDSLDINDPKHRSLSAYRLIAKMPTIAAMAYKTSIGQPIVYPRAELSYAENFLYMMFALPSFKYQVNPVMAKAMEVFLILHLDHEQNASTSTVRIAGSSHANPFACVASGIAALWGPAHGGANEAVLKMLHEIQSEDRIPQFIARAKDKADNFRLMGFGHRVYKNYDPRAKRMKEMCYEVLEARGIKDDPLLKLALAIEKIALADEYFVKRKLFPNVDFYSGICLRAMGIPTSMFTVLFAVARTVGWISQWKEMIQDPHHVIGRPRQLYMGEKKRDFVEVAKRLEPEEIVDVETSGVASPTNINRVTRQYSVTVKSGASP